MRNGFGVIKKTDNIYGEDPYSASKIMCRDSI